MDVLVCGLDESLLALISLNLARRGSAVRQAHWTACCGTDEQVPAPAEVVILDLDCPEPRSWQGAARARQLFPRQALLLLADSWPSPARLQDLQPCRYVRKPFAIHDFLRSLHELAPAAGH